MPENNQAVEALLQQQREQEKTKRYVQAYRQNPETKEEIEAARHAASAILSGGPW